MTKRNTAHTTKVNLLQYESGFFSLKCMTFLIDMKKKNNNLKATSGTNPSHSAGGDKA